MRQISLCLTNYNRTNLLIESFISVINDDRISEIVISDDHSDIGIYEELKRILADIPKVTLYRNERNVGMSLNKKIAIEKASNLFCIIFDSDNKITKEYIDALYNLPVWMGSVIYMPEQAQPQFIYSDFAGLEIDKKNIKRFLDKPMFDCLLNTCNYFVSKKAYLEVYEYNTEMKATDTIHFNYLWLKRGYCFYVVPNLNYYHRVHENSGFLEDAEYNLGKARLVKEWIRQLSETEILTK